MKNQCGCSQHLFNCAEIGRCHACGHSGFHCLSLYWWKKPMNIRNISSFEIRHTEYISHIYICQAASWGMVIWRNISCKILKMGLKIIPHCLSACCICGGNNRILVSDLNKLSASSTNKRSHTPLIVYHAKYCYGHRSPWKHIVAENPFSSLTLMFSEENNDSNPPWICFLWNILQSLSETKNAVQSGGSPELSKESYSYFVELLPMVLGGHIFAPCALTY